jgi:hypothetical protein
MAPFLLDPLGNVYAGTSSRDTTYQFTIYKLSQSGNLIWKVKENQQQSSRLKDMKIDAEGNIYAIEDPDMVRQIFGLLNYRKIFPASKTRMKISIPALSIFPNPSDQFCRINFLKQVTMGISVFDQSGKIVYTSTSSSSNSLLLNSSKWANGIYLLYCFDRGRNKIFTAKIVKAN